MYHPSHDASCHSSLSLRRLESALAAMRVQYSVHPKGLDPFQSAKAWHLRNVQGLPWKNVRVCTASGGRAKRIAVANAVRRIDDQRATAAFRSTGVATTAYRNCGRKQMLTPQQKCAIVAFVKQWRHKRFCTSAYIAQELQLSCGRKTIIRALNAAGYHWRPASKRGKLSEAQLAARKSFVDAHINKPASWWRQSFGLVLDGPTWCSQS